MLARRKAKLPFYLNALREKEYAEKYPGCLLNNFHNLLRFWQRHYLNKDKDSTCLENVSSSRSLLYAIDASVEMLVSPKPTPAAALVSPLDVTVYAAVMHSKRFEHAVSNRLWVLLHSHARALGLKHKVAQLVKCSSHQHCMITHRQWTQRGITALCRIVSNWKLDSGSMPVFWTDYTGFLSYLQVRHFLLKERRRPQSWKLLKDYSDIYICLYYIFILFYFSPVF